jgi:hypothetical protein
MPHNKGLALLDAVTDRTILDVVEAAIARQEQRRVKSLDEAIL